MRPQFDQRISRVGEQPTRVRAATERTERPDTEHVDVVDAPQSAGSNMVQQSDELGVEGHVVGDRQLPAVPGTQSGELGCGI